MYLWLCCIYTDDVGLSADVTQKVERRLNQPGTDQSIVQGAMLTQRWVGRFPSLFSFPAPCHSVIRMCCTDIVRGRRQLSWEYLPDRHVVLIDKVFKFETTAIELGGEVSTHSIGVVRVVGHYGHVLKG